MNRAMLSLIATMLLAPATSRAQAISTKPPSEAKIRLLVNVNYNLTERNFAESSTFTSFLETGSENRSYAGGTGLAFELGGIYSITGSIGIMGSFELLSAEHDAIFEVNEPHPLLFNQNRSISSELTALEYQEQALHIDFVYSVESGSMTIDVFGGPTFFFTETELIDDVITSSAYPFDELVLDRTTTVKLNDNPIGFNAGGALTYRFTPVIGVAFQARYSVGTATLDRDNGTPFDIDVGGFRIGGGIRLAF